MRLPTAQAGWARVRQGVGFYRASSIYACVMLTIIMVLLAWDLRADAATLLGACVP